VEPSKIPVPEVGAAMTVAVVNPASFMLQRLLIIPNRRELAKKAKDTPICMTHC